MQVLQYRKPRGPPMGVIPSLGIGALTGQETGGRIPGSVVAVFHNVTRVEIARSVTARTVIECVVHLRGGTKMGVDISLSLEV